jgi:beta-lactamase superfamily II metal-dependent hydrolase
MSNGNDDRLLVRIYRVGFGDCILLRVPDQGVMRHILIDCGNLWGEKIQPLKDALANAREVVAGDRLDLLVATHEHWDHIKGFETGLAKLKDQVDRVWLTVAMKRGLAEASGLTELRARAAGLWQGLAAQGAALGAEANSWLANSLSTEDAARALRETLPAKTAYVYRGCGETLPFSDPTTRLHILAPEKEIDATYLGAVQGLLAAFEGDLGSLDGEEAGATGSEEVEIPWPSHISRSDFTRLVEGLGAFRLLWAAAELTQEAINNSSVVLLLEWGGRRLLFPGDAQWDPEENPAKQRGSWQVMQQHDTAAAPLLGRRIDFLKVGHHGSHNATPYDTANAANPINALLDVLMPAEHPLAQAVVSTNGAGRFKESVPDLTLMQELGRRVANQALYEGAPGPQPQRTDVEPLPEGKPWVDVWIEKQ